MKAPCYHKGADCPNRSPTCRADCRKWKMYEAWKLLQAEQAALRVASRPDSYLRERRH